MINAAFKVFWDNPIEMKTEVGEQPLEFNIPLGAIIADPSVSSDLSNYYTKPETDTQITNAVATKANTTYVDAKIQQTITDGVTTSAPSQDVVHDALLTKQNLPTGYVIGWELSIDPNNNAKFRIAIGGGVITDFSDVLNIRPVIKQTSTMLTGLTPQYLATHPASYIAFDANLNVVQSSSPFTNEQRRTLIILGSVIHSNNININVTNEIKAPIVSPTNQLHDFMLAVGVMNLKGNELVPNGSNLSVNITAGTMWKMGVNAPNQYNPHVLDFSLRTAPSFAYRLRNSTEYAASTLLDPTNYDLNGVRTTLSNNNRWSIQRFYLFQSGIMRVQYGQAEYSSYQNALNALLSEPFSTEQNIKDNGLLIARIIIKKTCTDLQADITAGIASIHVADKFGNTSSAAAVTSQAIVGALGYTPASTRKTVNPQSTSYTLQITDAANIVRTTGSSASNITVPNSSTVAFTTQDRIEVEWYGIGQPTIVAASGVTVRVLGGGSLALPQQYCKATLEYVGSNEWILFKEDVGSTGGGSSSPTWVNITTVGTIPAYVTNADIQVARFQGMLWLKGTFQVNITVGASSEIFRITSASYKPYAYSAAASVRNLALINAMNVSAATPKTLGVIALGNITNSTQASNTDVIFDTRGSLVVSDNTINIPPVIIGTLVI